MDTEKVINAVRKLHDNAKPEGTIVINKTIYHLSFNRYQGFYTVVNYDTKEYIMDINTRKINEAKKFLREYFNN